MILKKLLRPTGSSMALIMMAIAALSGTTYVMMKQVETSKKSAKSVQIKKNQELLENKLVAFLSETAICDENFKGQNPTNTYTLLKRNGVNFLEVNNTVANAASGTVSDAVTSTKIYGQGSLRVTGIRTEQVSPTDYTLHISYQKKITGSKVTQAVSKQFTLKGELDSDDKIDYCYLDQGSTVEEAVNSALTKVCNGPGIVSADPACTMIEFESTTCDPGYAVAGHEYGATSGNLSLVCKRMVTEVGDQAGADTECAFGLKYSSNAAGELIPGKFECFNLDDLISEQTTTVQEGAECSIALDTITNKYKLSCGAGQVTPPASCSASTEYGQALSAGDIGSSQSITTTQTCSGGEPQNFNCTCKVDGTWACIKTHECSAAPINCPADVTDSRFLLPLGNFGDTISRISNLCVTRTEEWRCTCQNTGAWNCRQTNPCEGLDGGRCADGYVFGCVDATTIHYVGPEMVCSVGSHTCCAGGTTTSDPVSNCLAPSPH